MASYHRQLGAGVEAQRWEIIRRSIEGISAHIDLRWQRPPGAYDWNTDTGLRMLARDLICDAIDLGVDDELPAELRDLRAVLHFAGHLREDVGDRAWALTSDDIRWWLRDHHYARMRAS